MEKVKGIYSIDVATKHYIYSITAFTNSKCSENYSQRYCK